MVFLFISLCYAFAVHRIVRKRILGALLAAIFSAITFQIAGYFVVGYVDPFAPIAIVTMTIIAFAIAITVGFVLEARR